VADAHPPRPDFYAGATALFAIILFAKFVTHRRHDSTPSRAWSFMHGTCVALSWLGVAASMWTLARDRTPVLGESPTRSVVLIVALLCAVILALDVADARGPISRWTRWSSRDSRR
jgi:hypothetical protein